MNYRYFLIIVFSLFSFIGKAQIWEIGLTAGSMGYIGDLNQRNYTRLTNIAYGGSIKNNIDGTWSVKLSILKGQIGANDEESKYEIERNRNLSFYTPITEGSLQVEFNFFDYGRLFGKKRITPFLFSGISAFSFNPKTKFQGQEYMLRQYKTEGQANAYKKMAISIPFGVGLKVNLSKNFNLAGEFGYRLAKTDYLDDVSTSYPTAQQLSDSNPDIAALRAQLSDRSLQKIGTPGTQRGDFRKNDTYLFAGITLSYTFVSQKCYSF